MSMNEETLSRMQRMRLLGMHAAFKASQENFTLDKMTNDELYPGSSPTNGMTDVTEPSIGLSKQPASDMRRRLNISTTIWIEDWTVI